MKPRERRTICVVTGTRAEYGLLVPLMNAVREDPDLDLRLVATGTHLSSRYGETYRAIEADGFTIDHKVPLDLSDDSPTGIARAMGQALVGFSEYFEGQRPDVVVVLGDRFETMTVAQAAMLTLVPLAHVHGGETTEGAFDEAIRHSISKMAQLHFVSAEVYRDRVVQLGESPDRVFWVGAIGLDHLASMDFFDREALERAMEFELGQRNFLVTYHPVTLDEEPPERPLGELLAALDAYPDAHVVFTGANADTGGDWINSRLRDYCQQAPERRAFFMSLGQRRYLSMLREADVVIGNSSSAILEAPSFRCPTVNIGARQKGRVRAPSVIDCAEDREAIQGAIDRALSPEFTAIADAGVSPYFRDGKAGQKISSILREFDLTGIIQKRFHDLG